MAIWPDAYAAGVCDADARGQWQSVLPYDESAGLIAGRASGTLLMQLNIWRRGGLAQGRAAGRVSCPFVATCNDFFYTRCGLGVSD